MRKGPPSIYLRKLINYNIRLPFERVAVDVVELQPEETGVNRCLKTFADYFLNKPEAFLVRTNDAETVT